MNYCLLLTKDLLKLHTDYTELLNKHKELQASVSNISSIPPNSAPQPVSAIERPQITPPPISAPPSFSSIPVMQPPIQNMPFYPPPYPFIQPGPLPPPTPFFQQRQPVPQNPKFPDNIPIPNGDIMSVLISMSTEEFEGAMQKNTAQVLEFANLVISGLQQIVFSTKRYKEDSLERILYFY